MKPEQLTANELALALKQVERQMGRDAERDYEQAGPYYTSDRSKQTVRRWQALDAELKRRQAQ